MGTIAEKLEYAIDSKEMIKDAIMAKGVEVGDDVTLREYAEKIVEISGGGGIQTKEITLNNFMSGNAQTIYEENNPDLNFKPNYIAVETTLDSTSDPLRGYRYVIPTKFQGELDPRKSPDNEYKIRGVRNKRRFTTGTTSTTYYDKYHTVTTVEKITLTITACVNEDGSGAVGAYIPEQKLLLIKISE